MSNVKARNDAPSENDKKRLLRHDGIVFPSPCNAGLSRDTATVPIARERATGHRKSLPAPLAPRRSELTYPATQAAAFGKTP
jgi:hypothetical protein